MKFLAASAVFSFALYSMKIGGVEGATGDVCDPADEVCYNITVNEVASAYDMVAEIVGDGFMNLINTDTIKLIGDIRCSGIFANGKNAMAKNKAYNYTSDLARFKEIESRFPDEGIILSSGQVKSLEHNVRDPSDVSYTYPGDTYLDEMVNKGIAEEEKAETFDACILEFNFVSPADATLSFEYLFGSDEYNNYADSEFHDVFALVLNDENIAIVPNTEDTYVGINTVNRGKSGTDTTKANSEFFINNQRTRDEDYSPYHGFEPNGFTTMLEAKGKVKGGINNKISFRIADVNDREYDSWVLITHQSLIIVDPKPPSPTKDPKPPSPTKDPKPPSPTKAPAYEKGDPHFMTWAGEAYDFHGVCDLVLVHVAAFGNGLGMDIYIRSKKMKIWSYTASAAVRIGQNIVEVIGGGEAKFLTNGVEEKLKSTEDGISLVSTISEFPIHRIRNIGKGDTFTINLGNNEKIVISTWHLFVSVSFENARSETFEGSAGLLGSFSGGLKLARDGTTTIKDFNEYGQEWQVRASEPQLFHSVEGPQYPSKCEIPSSTEMRRRLGESKLTMNQARKACVNVNEPEINLCIFDVLATNDKFTAGAY